MAGISEAAKATHTAGPWEVEQIDYELYGLDRSFEVKAGRLIVVQTHLREIKSEGQLLAADEANCRLISAAPDAVILAEAVLDESEQPHLRAMARDWLAKARGEA